MKNSISSMTSKEKQELILLPMVMALLCVAMGFVSYLAAVKDGNPDVAYALWAVVGFFFIYGATLWWSSLKRWRNGKSRKRDTEERKN